jgi:hypothetical protein
MAFEFNPSLSLSESEECIIGLCRVSSGNRSRDRNYGGKHRFHKKAETPVDGLGLRGRAVLSFAGAYGGMRKI